ncbi:hypothetical protein [Streptomyces sp. WMMB303]|uniref:hypothetical protein n=1 Tax=unclassified Streptomyces TaxID=2593676 RepID=UPI0023EDE45E|nr:hypothetical protein [Streptomyces sp. WMMB303]MDF4252785.1 hypothetical protein [Streptomyces sp. WMMB303]
MILLNILTVWLFGWGMLYVISFSALEALTGGQHGTYTPLLALPGMMCGVFAAWGFTARRQDAQVAHSWGIAASFMYAWLGLALLMETFSNTPGLVPDGTAHWSTGVVVAVEGILLFCFFRAKLRRAFE